MSRTNLFIIYHTMLFLKYVKLILHIFLSMFCLSVLIGLLFLIAGDWTMVDGTRKIAALYKKIGASGLASGRGRGKGGGKGKGACLHQNLGEEHGNS